MAKAKISPFSEITGPSPETLTSVLDLLEVKKPELRKAHGDFLHGTVCSFEMARAFQKAYATDHQVMDQLRDLTDLLNKAESSMQALRPDIRVMIQNLEDPPYSSDDWKGLLEGLQKLSGIISKSKTAKLKRHKVDVVFERYVSFLMLRIRDATGKLAHARASDDRYDRPTRLASKEAEAIWMLLKHIEGVTENNVANRIIKLERLHRDQLEQAYPEYDLTGGNLTHLTAKD